MRKKIMIIAGEASGDLHGANLVRALRRRDKRLSCCGVGGQALRDTGMRILVDAATLSVVGITEVFAKIPEILKGANTVKRYLRTESPDLLILIDFPDFNLHIAETAKRLGIPILYYISPQIWAWRSGRVRRIARLVDHMAVILPFEAAFYRKHKVPVTYVGHPLLDFETRNPKPEIRNPIPDEKRRGKESEIRSPTKNVGEKNPIPDKKRRGEESEVQNPILDVPYRGNLGERNLKSPIVGLLPGSRGGEIATHLPIMLEAAHMLSRRHEDIRFVISLAPSVKEKTIRDIMSHFSLLTTHDPRPISIVRGTDEIFETCSILIAVSGTVTLQAAIAGLPMVVIYKVSPISYLIGRAMIRVRHISLANLIAGREMIPELIQADASPENIASTVSGMVNDPARLAQMREELLSIRGMLGGPGASERVADIIAEMLKRGVRR